LGILRNLIAPLTAFSDAQQIARVTAQALDNGAKKVRHWHGAQDGIAHPGRARHRRYIRFDGLKPRRTARKTRTGDDALLGQRQRINCLRLANFSA
jgi:hypothetical protein